MAATLAVQIRNAYRAGWNASAKINGPRLEAAEDTYLARGRSDAQHDAWVAGWIDYASDYAYGTALVPTPALASQDGTPRNVSGMVANVTGNGRTGGTHGEPSRVSVRGYGRADHAAHRVIADLAVRLYGASTSLTPVVI